MRGGRSLLASLLITSCARAPVVAPAEPVTAATVPGVPWGEVRAEIEALVCIATLDVPGHGSIEKAWYGDRERCGLPPASTPLERAIVGAYEDARPALIAIRRDEAAVLVAMKLTDEKTRLQAIRREYLSDRFLGMLLPRLTQRMSADRMKCDGCPAPVRPIARTIEWSALAPYVAAYVWPDPIVTPRGPDGKPSGAPKYSLHICSGKNGVAEMSAPEPDLLVAAFLGTIHTDVVHETARATLSALRDSSDFTRITSDDEQTEYLREHLGPTVASDPAVLPAICETLARFREDTGISVRECAGH